MKASTEAIMRKHGIIPPSDKAKFHKPVKKKLSKEERQRQALGYGVTIGREKRRGVSKPPQGVNVDGRDTFNFDDHWSE